MGLRASCLFVSSAPNYFATNPKFDETMVPEAFKILGINPAKCEEPLEFCDAVNPPGDFALGVYEKGLFYGSKHLLEGSALEHVEKIKPALEAKFGYFQALLIQTYSPVGLFGYALYENNQLVRAYGGNDDDGITVDFGELQPEEIPLFALSKLKSGERFFDGPFGEMTAVSYGTLLIDAVAVRFLGRPLNACLRDFPLQVESFVVT